MFVVVDRDHELEDLRRRPATGLSREDAMALIAEVQRAEDRLRRLRDGLQALLAGDCSPGSCGWSGAVPGPAISGLGSDPSTDCLPF